MGRFDPRPHESGTSTRRRSISKRGSARTRAALYFPAVTAASLQGPLQEFYLRIVERTGQKMDVNGDVVDTDVVNTVDGVDNFLNPPFVEPVTDVYGETTFSGVTQIGGWGLQGDDLAISFRLRDLTDRLSAPISMPVPPIVGVGDPCTGNDLFDRCEDGSSCDAGTCIEHAPEVSGVTTRAVNAGRDLAVVVEGWDPDRDLDEAAFTFTGGGFDDDAQTVRIGSPSAAPHTLSWSGDVFTLEVTFAAWGDEESAGRTNVGVVVTDELDQASAPAFGVVQPVRNLGESCDETTVTDRCQGGLLCDAGVCATDTADPCAGAPLDDALDLASWSGTSLNVPLQMVSGNLVVQSYCPNATYSKAKGPERVMRFVPEQDGTLVAKTVTPGADQVFQRVTEGQCVVPDEPLECARYDAEVTVAATTGVPLYFVVDTYYYQTGEVELHLDWQE